MVLCGVSLTQQAMRNAKVDDMSVALKEDKLDWNKMRSYGADKEQVKGLDKEEGTIGSSPGETEKEEVAAPNPPSGVMEGENGGPGHNDRDKGKSPSYGNMFELVIYCPWTKQCTGYRDLATSGGGVHDRSTAATTSKVKLVLYRCLFLVFGVTILVGGGVSSHFHVLKGNTADCEVHNTPVNTSVLITHLLH